MHSAITTKACRIATLVLVAVLFPALPGESGEPAKFDHFTTGFRLEGAHRFADCAACHTDGMFVGTPTQCAGCHMQSNRVRASTKSPNHILTTDLCESCHQDYTWEPVTRVDHLEVIGPCASCHNGFKALGKPANHIPATDLCGDCHNTMMFSPVRRVDHMQVLGTCSGCHNGLLATGKNPQHIPTTAECDSCHNTIYWQ